jgi:ubiquinone/menaquinone biosynthesis C-methylase UbiE
MVKRASGRVPAAEVKEGSAEHLDFDDETFTCVFSIAALHHWADRDGGIAELMRVLVPGGAFYLVDGELKPGKDGHGLTPEEAESLAREIDASHGTESRVDKLRAGRSHYLVIAGSK